ncbi:sel1 repeat family protein (plasmid) [Phyllobacterium sp. 628]|uniref:tetratricopeptide repeat protein n=1 Tax=Phyllobacterium sp. 628 TaxID=2718938 RepID=UPI001662561B|nr:tetratricopeptide repeat protein [Phyllobacterium sp. 628]QND54569.1 sel1 repeat family protein [Phyllobacterium sp. 628]
MSGAMPLDRMLRGNHFLPMSIRIILLGLFISAASVFTTTFAKADNAQDAYANGDYKAAMQLWKTQAHTGDVVAMFGIGDLYLLGEGVPKDHAEAAKWYRRAAELGYGRAQSYLGAMYRNGDGVPQNKDEALRWYHKAADQNIPAALNALGDMYLNGEGVPKSESEAMKWYQKLHDAN